MRRPGPGDALNLPGGRERIDPVENEDLDSGMIRSQGGFSPILPTSGGWPFSRSPCPSADVGHRNRRRLGSALRWSDPCDRTEVQAG